MQIIPGNFRSGVYVTIQFICIIYLVLTGRIFSSDFLIFFFTALFLFIGIWAVSIMKLKFNVVPEIQEGASLNTSGPYRFIRHPMYLSALGITLCWVADTYTIPRLIIWFVLLADLYLKLTYEEKLLTERFSTYSEYVRRTKKIIPYIW